jgi:hypothetical protein
MHGGQLQAGCIENGHPTQQLLKNEDIGTKATIEQLVSRCTALAAVYEK